MLQNTTITAFTVSELLRENQQRVTIIPHPLQIRVKGTGFCIDLILTNINTPLKIRLHMKLGLVIIAT